MEAELRYRSLTVAARLVAARLGESRARASKGANIEIWNKKNRFGWTPLRIAEGYRFGNFKPSPDTIAAFHKVMKERGVAPVSEPAGAGDAQWKPN